MYEVTWSPEAEAELTSLWLSARDRLHIGEVTRLLDKQLRQFPDMLGESRQPSHPKPERMEERVAFESSFTIMFRIDYHEQAVTVTSFARNSNSLRD